MKKEQMINELGEIINIIETAVNEVETRDSFENLNSKIAQLGNYEENQLPLVYKIAQFYINSSDTHESKRGKNGGIVNSAWKKTQTSVAKKAAKVVSTNPEKAKVTANLSSKMITGENIIKQKFPLDENDIEETDEG